MAKINYPSTLWLSGLCLSVLTACQSQKVTSEADTAPPPAAAAAKKKELPPEAQFAVPSASTTQPAALPVESPPASLPDDRTQSAPRVIQPISSNGEKAKFTIEVAGDGPKMASPEEVLGRSFPTSSSANTPPPPLPAVDSQPEPLPEPEAATAPPPPELPSEKPTLSAEVDPNAPTMSRRPVTRRQGPAYYGTSVPEREEPVQSSEHGSDPIVSTKRRAPTEAVTSENQAQETTIEKPAAPAATSDVATKPSAAKTKKK
jgi:nicotinate-nucleotide--dimethylbenzimidazole phosphoribosyltransferase